MTGQERDYDDVLSRVLHSTTDHIEPVGDGLAKIRERLAEPWLKRQWLLLRSEFMAVGWLLVVRCESFYDRVRPGSPPAYDPADTATTAGAAVTSQASHAVRLRLLLATLGGAVARAFGAVVRAASGQRGDAAAGGRKSAPRGGLGPTMTWLRPAMAVAGAVVLVVAGVFALGGIHQGFVSLGDNGTSHSGPASQAPGNGGPNGVGRRSHGSATPTPQGSRSRKRAPTTHHALITPSPSPCSSPSSSPGGSTPTPEPTTASPTPSPSPSPTVTPTASPSPTTSSGALVPTQGATAGRAIKVIKTSALVCTGVNPSPTTGGSPV